MAFRIFTKKAMGQSSSLMIKNDQTNQILRNKSLKPITLSSFVRPITHGTIPDLHEPAYLEDLKPKVGYYELLNLQLKGYDFVVLEKYQSYLNKTMKRMNFNITKAWSAPHQELLLENLSDRSTSIETSYKIKIYERNIQMKDALVTKLPILIDIINITSPPGVSFSIHRHTDADEDKIYLKDSVLEKLKEDLQELKDTPLIGVT